MAINPATISDAKLERAIDRVITTYKNFNPKKRCTPQKIFEMTNTCLEENVPFYMVKERFTKTNAYKQVLEYLHTVPKIEQRSPEWYEIRKGLLTASDMGQACGVGKFGSPTDLLKKKCGYEPEKPFNPDIPPLKWGVRYEQVATDIYQARNSVIVHEFGLIPHEKYTFFGASPDGISELGIMLEIKCPYKRKIDGHIPEQYYYQIQGQLDTCNLEECDYLECKLSEYEDEEDFLDDRNREGNLTRDNMEKGIVVEYRMEGEEFYRYHYSAVVGTDEEKIQWKENVLGELSMNDQVEFYEVYYWRLDLYHVKRVYRDIDFFEDKIEKIGQFWDRVTKYREDYESYKTDVEEPEKKKPRRGGTTKKVFNLTDSGLTETTSKRSKPKPKAGGYLFMDDSE